MNILFIHQNFPGQFRHIAQDLAKNPEHQVLAIGHVNAPGLPGVRMLRYRPHRSAGKETHQYLQSFESAVLYGQAVLRLLLKLKHQGYKPDVVVAHPGWGETLFIKEVFPHVRLIHFCEYYYHPTGADAGFDPEFPLTLDGAARIRTRNALHLLNLENCDVGVTPTHWQHSLHPKAYQSKIHVIHEGVDTEQLYPDPNATLTLPNGTTLRKGQPIVTYVARNLEPYRGFHTFMRSLPMLLEAHPTVQVVIVGGDDTSYGSKPKDAPNWRTKMLSEVSIDTNRVHFLGRVPYDTYKTILQLSSAHVYLTYPFVLSWSMLEAMATGCVVIGSNTAPVREVIQDKKNGLLVDFQEPQQVSSSILTVLNNHNTFEQLRCHAQKSIQTRYNVASGLAGWWRILTQV